MSYDSLYRRAEEKNEAERHQFYAGADRVIKSMPESLCKRRKRTLEPEGDEDNGNSNDRNSSI